MPLGLDPFVQVLAQHDAGMRAGGWWLRLGLLLRARLQLKRPSFSTRSRKSWEVLQPVVYLEGASETLIIVQILFCLRNKISQLWGYCFDCFDTDLFLGVRGEESQLRGKCVGAPSG